MQGCHPKIDLPLPWEFCCYRSNPLGYLERFCDLQVVSVNLEAITALDRRLPLTVSFNYSQNNCGGGGWGGAGPPTIKSPSKFLPEAQQSMSLEVASSAMDIVSTGYITSSFPGCFHRVHMRILKVPTSKGC